MCSPARRSILLYIPYVVKFGQTARAHYANIQEVRNSGAGVSAFRRDAVTVSCPADESSRDSAALFPLHTYIITIDVFRLFYSIAVVPGGATATTSSIYVRRGANGPADRR